MVPGDSRVPSLGGLGVCAGPMQWVRAIGWCLYGSTKSKTGQLGLWHFVGVQDWGDWLCQWVGLWHCHGVGVRSGSARDRVVRSGIRGLGERGCIMWRVVAAVAVWGEGAAASRVGFAVAAFCLSFSSSSNATHGFWAWLWWLHGGVGETGWGSGVCGLVVVLHEDIVDVFLLFCTRRFASYGLSWPLAGLVTRVVTGLGVGHVVAWAGLGCVRLLRGGSCRA